MNETRERPAQNGVIVRKYALAVIAALTLSLFGATAAQAQPIYDAPFHATVRPGDFVPAYSDTRATGHVQFLTDGLHVYTEGNTSTDKAAEYFEPAATTGLPNRGRMTWYGTQPQPGVQIVFDADGIARNDDDYNVLVGEPAYGVDGEGYYTDWWLTNGSSGEAKSKAPVVGPGSGSLYHGTLAQWQAAFPNAIVSTYGFSLGSGVKGDGVIASMTLGQTSYGFTRYDFPQPTPPATVQDVTGTFAKRIKPHATTLTFQSAALNPGSVQGKPLVWTVTVDGVAAANITQSADQTDRYRYRAAGTRRLHKVKVYANGALVDRYKVGTRIRVQR